LNLSRGIFNAVGYTPDGQTLVSLNSRNSIRFWDLATFTERLAYQLKEGEWAANEMLSVGGSYLAVGNTLYDASSTLALLAQPTTGRKGKAPLTPIPLGTSTETNFVLVTPRGEITALTYEASGWRGSARIHYWQRPDQQRRDFTTGLNYVHGVSISPDGRLVAVGEMRSVNIYQLATGEMVRTVGHTDAVQRTCFSADGRMLAVAAGRTVSLWDVAEGKILARFPSFRRFCVSLAFHPSAPLLVAGGREGEIRLFDTQALRETVRYDWDIGIVNGLAFSPDGTTAAAAGHQSTLVVWDID
jgi:WD40 repeat protein